jgi:hypothetical protein
MKAKRLSFAFICFLESGLFNELRPIQIKKLLPASTGCSSLFSSDAPSLDGSGQDKQIAQISVLDKKLPSHSGCGHRILAEVPESPEMSVPGNVAGGVSPATSRFSDRHVDELEFGELRQTFLPSSLPIPELFPPPNGTYGRMSRCLLIHTVPASICKASRDGYDDMAAPAINELPVGARGVMN